LEQQAKIRVGVVFGGRSAEHEVSLESARNVIAALDPARFTVVPIGISKAGRWLIGPQAMPRLQAAISGVADFGDEPMVAASLGAVYDGHALVQLAASGQQQSAPALDVIFPVLHGPFGEDGTVQGLLELAGLPYVGSGVLGSALGMDKVAMKAVFKAEGLPLVPYKVFYRVDWDKDLRDVLYWTLRAVERGDLCYPLFVKPANMGSSIGVSKARGEGDLQGCFSEAFKYDRKVVVEQGVVGQEVECAVLGNDTPAASVVGEVIPGNEFYDYNAKYVDDNSALLIPARLSETQAAEVQRLAVRAFHALDCAGMARVDFFVAKETGKVYLNEVNTIPGFTSISMYPKLWQASGLNYSQLVERLITLALERHGDKQRNLTDR